MTSSQGSPSSTPRLRPADFGDEDESPVRPVLSTMQKEPTTPDLHWSLQKIIDPSKYLTLFGRLPHKLSSTNYVSWMFSVEATLDTIDLVDYVKGNIHTHKPNHANYPNWRAANALVRSILVTNMAEEVAVQMSHLRNAHEIWSEARRLFSGQTMTDFTLTITSLVTTKYVDGEDVAAHIVKMKGFRRDLMLMNRDLEDGLFASSVKTDTPK